MVSEDVDQHQGANAVSAITPESAFLGKHQDAIAGVLSCFDRLIFRGHLPLSYPRGLEGFLHRQGVLLKDFKHYAPKIAERVKAHVKEQVERAGAPFRHLPRKVRMEEEARQRAEKLHIRAGIVCGFAQLETCRTYRLAYGEGRPRLKKDFRRCTVLYVFLMHPLLGLIHVKLETWFPLTMQVYANGHDFVAKKLDVLGVPYSLADNAFVAIKDFKAAQACADRLPKQNWPKLLGALARQFNPLLAQELKGQDYYWVTDQSEYATDVLFKEGKALAAVDNDRATREQIDRLTKPAPFRGAAKRALQPLSPADQELFKAVLRGEHRLHGFRNRDLAQALYPRKASDRAERRRRCGRVTRLIQLLRAHHLVAKIAGSRRYRVTPLGERLMMTAIYVRHHYLPKELHETA